ncbi:MAG: HAD-IB family phosphatase [Clostridia bacterium]|nr:HAD-IB family phosphatase [Clostridia bacterium]
MNVYDFDKTISFHDSTERFYFFCLKKKPSLVRFLPMQGYYALGFALKLMKKTQFKEKFYRVFSGIPDIDAFVDEFWKENISDIKDWYRKNRRDDDVVISASPEFLLAPICRELGVGTLIASRVDKKTGKYTGENCYGEEKVLRYREVFGDSEIDEFYSDSYSDTPLARLAKKAYIVKDEELSDWVF